MKNVVLIITDQQKADAIGCVDPSYKTPNIDWLAAKGVRFSNAICSGAQCTPSRASIVTGLYPHQTGIFQIGHCLSARYHTVAKEFKNNGYKTAHFGKWHLYSKLKEHGYDIIDYRADGLERKESESENYTEDMKRTAKAINFLNDYKDEKPFFLTVSLINPHPPFEKVKPFVDMYTESDLKIPGSFYEDDLSTKPPWQSERARKGESLLNAEIVKDDNIKYRSMVSYADWCVGKLLEALKNCGKMENTVIAFTSDHGDMQGAHRLRLKGIVAYKEIFDIPYIFYIPGMEAKRKVVDDLVVNTSLPGTLLEAAGLKVPDCFEGGSVLTAMMRDRSPENEEVFFEHWRAYWAMHPLIGVRTKKYKYVYYFQDDYEEMYDLEKDPDECVNIADNKEAKEIEYIKKELRAKVEKWWEATGALSVKPILATKGGNGLVEEDGLSDKITGEWANLI